MPFQILELISDNKLLKISLGFFLIGPSCARMDGRTAFEVRGQFAVKMKRSLETTSTHSRYLPDGGIFIKQ